MKIRGYVALAVACVALLLADPVQRFVISPWVRLFPSRRIRVLTRWQHWMAAIVLGSVGRIGGAHIPALPSIEGRSGTLVLMNHQSILDIPLVVASIRGAYPRIVTRRRYQRRIPLISHMVRLYQYPVVDPAANAGSTRRSLTSLAHAARDSDVPLAVFPEGTRTKDGEIGRFKTNGLRHILGQRSWTVHVLVADGFWERAKLVHFLSGMSSVSGSIRHLGPFPWNVEGKRTEDVDAFVAEIRAKMIAALAEMRSGVAA